jgi:membrane-associated phospholipid phosphatase
VTHFPSTTTILLWVAFGLLSLIIGIRREKKKVKKTFFGYLADDIRESPIPASCGYGFMILLGPVSLVNQTLCERD